MPALGLPSLPAGQLTHQTEDVLSRSEGDQDTRSADRCRDHVQSPKTPWELDAHSDFQKVVRECDISLGGRGKHKCREKYCP